MSKCIEYTTNYEEREGYRQLTKGSEFSAGYDIRSHEDIWVLRRSSVSVGTGLSISIPEGTVGIVKSRSGLSFKNNIEVGAGVIDSDYRGEVKVKLYNHGNEDFKVCKGDRIAQIIVFPVFNTDVLKVDNLDDTDRGSNGFGSSGIQ